MSPNAGGGGKLRGLSQWVQLYTGAQINFADLTPYLTYGCRVSERGWNLQGRLPGFSEAGTGEFQHQRSAGKCDDDI
jgi:hypothetical protein